MLRWGMAPIDETLLEACVQDSAAQTERFRATLAHLAERAGQALAEGDPLTWLLCLGQGVVLGIATFTRP